MMSEDRPGDRVREHVLPGADPTILHPSHG